MSHSPSFVNLRTYKAYSLLPLYVRRFTRTMGSGFEHVHGCTAWPWPVFRLKRTKFRFVIRAKKAQISFLITFCKKKIRTFRVVYNAFRKILHISQNFVKLCGIDLYSLPILSFKPRCGSLTTYKRFRVRAYCTSASSKLGSCQRLRCRVDHQTGSSIERRHVRLKPSSV
jgi:hypothetical protein